MLLKEREGGRVLPICIGRGEEGYAVVAQLAGATFNRPVTPDSAPGAI